MKVKFSLFSLLLTFSYFKLYSCIAESHDQFRITDLVKFTIYEDDEELGTFLVGLYGETVPMTVKNFISFVKGVEIHDKFYTYKGVRFHRIIPNFVVQSGDVVFGNGMGSISIYGETFYDENYLVMHQPYVLAMANSGPNTNGCQFYITTTHTDWLNHRHVVFGRVIHGKEVIQKIEVNGSPDGTPKRDIYIKNVELV